MITNSEYTPLLAFVFKQQTLNKCKNTNINQNELKNIVFKSLQNRTNLGISSSSSI
jgi:hypothetical protein